MSGAHHLLRALIGGAPGVINAALPNGSVAGSATATWQLNNDGSLTVSGSSGNWVTPATAGVAALYQVKVDVTLGSFSTGTTGSYLDLSTTRTWTIVSAGDPESVTFTVTIREKATGIVRRTQAGVD